MSYSAQHSHITCLHSLKHRFNKESRVSLQPIGPVRNTQICSNSTVAPSVSHQPSMMLKVFIRVPSLKASLSKSAQTHPAGSALAGSSCLKNCADLQPQGRNAAKSTTQSSALVKASHSEHSNTVFYCYPIKGRQQLSVWGRGLQGIERKYKCVQVSASVSKIITTIQKNCSSALECFHLYYIYINHFIERDTYCTKSIERERVSTF